MSIFFDLIFITQHYCLYRDRSERIHYEEEEKEALVDHDSDIQGNRFSNAPPVKFFVWLTTQQRSVLAA